MRVLAPVMVFASVIIPTASLEDGESVPVWALVFALVMQIVFGWVAGSVGGQGVFVERDGALRLQGPYSRVVLPRTSVSALRFARQGGVLAIDSESGHYILSTWSHAFQRSERGTRRVVERFRRHVGLSVEVVPPDVLAIAASDFHDLDHSVRGFWRRLVTPALVITVAGGQALMALRVLSQALQSKGA